MNPKPSLIYMTEIIPSNNKSKDKNKNFTDSFLTKYNNKSQGVESNMK